MLLSVTKKTTLSGISSWVILTFDENRVANSETGQDIVRYAFILYEKGSTITEVISVGKEDDNSINERRD